MHVVRRGGEDLAILTWEPGVRRFLGMRDRIIGWSRVLTPTTSKVLAQSEARLEQDAQKRFGHGFLLAETFVDPSKGYYGGCYKAAGWVNRGLP
jgi:hypothetical protein